MIKLRHLTLSALSSLCFSALTFAQTRGNTPDPCAQPSFLFAAGPQFKQLFSRFKFIRNLLPTIFRLWNTFDGVRRRRYQ